MRYMLDTNICMYVMKAHPPKVLARLAEIDHGNVVMSVITFAELRVGIERLSANKLQNEQALKLLIREVPVLHFDEAAAENYGAMRATLPDCRRDVLDRLIAAHAASLKLTLVTNNEADFKDYPNLVVENWAI